MPVVNPSSTDDTMASSKNLDIESPVSPEPPPEHVPSYRSFPHASVAHDLQNVQTTGRLGSGPAEPLPAQTTALATVIRTVPWRMLVVQTLWSSAIMMVAYAFRNDQQNSSLSVPFWTSSFLISSSVVYGVGWALFVLLGFFIREASNRHRTARATWNNTMAHLRILVRNFVQLYPDAYWHPNDRDRILAHFMAYPIALKMMLRGEREREQLHNILHPLDVDDVIQSQEMHIHCTRVIRAYLSSSNPDFNAGFQPAMPHSPTALNTQVFQGFTVNMVDSIAAALLRIAEFQPALGYVNHLRIFLYIWLFFLPLALVETSGWFTTLWAVLITYGIGMLFVVANALNEPFGFDLQDIKLNALASAAALRFLNMWYEERPLVHNVKLEHNTPYWLEAECSDGKQPPKKKGIVGFFSRLRLPTVTKELTLALLVFLAWVSFIVFLTRGVSEDREDSEPGCRWWCLYIPLSRSTTSYVGLGVFLLMGFWINDAYARYWNGLQLWETSLKPHIVTVVTEIGIMCKSGTWHPRDIERLFSHIVAVAYASKERLRDSRDLSDLEGILAPEDIQAMSESKDLVDYCLRVVYAYLAGLGRCDKDTLLSQKRPLDNALVTLMDRFRDIENSMNACNTMRTVPISPSFTLHLHIFAALWLALFPLAFVQENGFLSYLYLPPIAYSAVKLLSMGNELSDPFGTDRNDIPLDMFCAEIKNTVHEIYKETRPGAEGYVHACSGYGEGFKKPVSKPQRSGNGHTTHMTVKQAVQKIFCHLPPVPLLSQVLITLWIIGAVFISYGLSFAWDDERRNLQCREWCSPVDIDNGILLEIGFALFLILSFRASDAMGRYENAGSLISNLEKELRAIIMETMNGYQAGSWHENDKERLYAHLIQIPLLLRDQLLGTNQSDEQRLLSDEDYAKCINSADPIRHCIATAKGYLLSIDVPGKESGLNVMKKRPFVPGSLMYTLYIRFSVVVRIVSQLRSIKRFPVVRSYTSHQRLFTILWLVLLPFGMTARTGFFTILWAPMIAYGILALESLATTLVDPIGDDDLDVPVDTMFTEMAERLVEAVRSSKWDYKHHVIESIPEGDARIGSQLAGNEVVDEYDLAKFSTEEVDASNFAEKPVRQFSGPKEPMTKPTFFAHLVRSVPWWALVAVAAWTAVGVLVSYLSRRDAENVRWWESRLSIDGIVVTYVGFPAFLLLGFFVQAAFDRYSEAGNVWGDDLRAACHSLSVQWLMLAKAGTWHEGDNDRVLGHIAAVPIALKMELRDERNVRELKGLLSEKDIGRIMCADSMSDHCVDVIRAYYFSGLSRPDEFGTSSPVIKGARTTHVKYEIENLQEALRRCKFIKSFPIARGFMVLLRAMIGIWFILVPFVLAESNGWFAILWVPIIGYGLIGMYSIADEIQQPFGRDLNDFNLDKMADSIVSGVLFVQQNYRGGHESLVVESVQHSGRAWEHFMEEDSVAEDVYSRLADTEKNIGSVSLRTSLSMIIHAVPLWMLVGVGIYSGLSVVAAWGLSRRWPLNESCSPAFCVPIAIDSVVKEYVGFALFLLLGFRLYDSHWRYVSALEAWRDGILQNTRLFGNRIFESFPQGTLHKGDSERIAAHLAAFSIVTAARLRREKSCAEILKDVMSAEDIERVERVEEKGDYCLDVIRGYLTAFDVQASTSEQIPCKGFILWLIIFYLAPFKNYAAACERMISIPLPFGYVQHIRIFLVIWLITLPFGLVETSGWWTTLWVVIIAYGVIGIERWSTELADPFGTDLSDLPLGKFRVDTVKSLRTNLKWFYNGNEGVVKPERTAFPLEEMYVKTIDE